MSPEAPRPARSTALDADARAARIRGGLEVDMKHIPSKKVPTVQAGGRGRGAGTCPLRLMGKAVTAHEVSCIGGKCAWWCGTPEDNLYGCAVRGLWSLIETLKPLE